MSPQKHAAQIANAQRSHGAVTEAGRQRSSANSTRHGFASRKLRIIPPQDREEFDQHCSQMLPALAPEGPIEDHLADLIVFDEWRIIRTRGLENEIFAMGFTTAKDQYFAGAETWLSHSKELATLTTYEQRISRVLSRNKAELEARQSARKASGADLLVCADSRIPEAPLIPPEEPKPEVPASIAVPETGDGFVHSSAAAPPTPDPQPVTTVAERPVGFVHSSASAPATPNPQPPAPKPGGEAAPGGFVRSSNSASPAPDPQPLTPAANQPPGALRNAA
jgi:hypothetical protein